MLKNSNIFREYDIRGIAESDLSSDSIYLIGRALATFYKKHNVSEIALGRDCRKSSPRIFDNLIDALLSSGISVTEVGEVPTPLLYFACASLNLQGGVMITGSHNPPEYNGLKIGLKQGTLFGSQIQEIKTIAEKKLFESGKGNLKSVSIVEPYLEYLKTNIHLKRKLNIVVDSGNGMAGMIATRLYSELGCKVIDLFPEPDGRFPNHHPDPTQPENLEFLKKALAAQPYDVGLGFDGDADRLGVMDPTGRLLLGDELMVLFSRSVLKTSPGATIISDVKASNRLFQDIEKRGGKPLMWKTGHSLIKAKMKETHSVLAGEMSGHLFFKDRYYGFDDALYAGARVLEILSDEKKSPLELISDLPSTFSTPELKQDCADELKFRVMDLIKKNLVAKGLNFNALDGVRLDFGDGWALVRASNTQPVLVKRFEATSASRLKDIQTEVESIVQKSVKEVESGGL